MKTIFTNAKVVGRQVDPASYHNQEHKRGEKNFVMSRSELAEFSKCPRRWLNGYRDDDSASTEYGSLLDCLLLDNERFIDRFIIRPETYTNEKGEVKEWSGNAKVCREWKSNAETSGKKIVKSEEVANVKQAIYCLTQNQLIESILASRKYQTYCTADYIDKETGIKVPLKILIDVEPESNELADLKSTNNASAEKWPWTVKNFNYHWQAALYLDIYNAATGEERDGFIHIVQESFHPYETAVHLLSLEFIQLGRDEYQLALKKYCQCLATGEWPGYGYNSRMINGMIVCEPFAAMVR